MLRRLVFLIALVLVVGACTPDAVDTSSTVAGGSTSPGSTPPDTGSTTPEGSTTTTQAMPPVTPPDLSGLEDLSVGVRKQLEDLIVTVQEVRGLPFLSPPNITAVTDAELEARYREAIEEGAEDFPADDALYKLLGLMDQEADLETLLLDLYGAQVAGFYDGETGEIVVPARQESLTLLQQGTMLHELVHALTDQHFGFDAQFRAMVDEERLDEATAYQALIEGDATLAWVMWVQSLSPQELGRLVAESLDVDRSSLDAVPQFISDSLLFPYDTGLAFVQELFATGDWNAVNDAYSTFPDLPGSSEQVITPADYQRDLPLVVELPTITIAGYNLERTSVWGEEGFRTMIDQVLGESKGAKAADGWGGDSYHQWFDGENAAFLLVYKGDTARDLEELRATLLEYALAAVPEEDFVWVDEEEGLLYFIAADEISVGELIRSAVGLG
ncbi:MAG: hypothetical protein E2O96_04740 [Acidobacteria bacterium]|nr:MAG: hypothetical protein E2O96_04740 [Acidobacteriota bacterium]